MNKIRIGDYIFWKNKYMYLNLSFKSINKQMKASKFKKQYFKLWHVDRSDDTKINELNINKINFKKLKNFLKLISKLFLNFDVFYQN